MILARDGRAGLMAATLFAWATTPSSTIVSSNPAGNTQLPRAECEHDRCVLFVLTPETKNFFRVSRTYEVRAQWITRRGKENGFVRRGRRHVRRRPADRVRRAARDARDLVAVESVHERGFPVHRRRAVALLPVVVVAPRVHLRLDVRL